MLIFGLNDKGGNLSGKGLSILGASLDDIKLGLSPIGEVQIDIVEKYNKAIQDTLNPVTAYYRALDDGTGTTVKCNKATRDLISSAKGAAVSQESMSTALKATSLSSKAAAVGMKALSIAGNMLVGIGIGLAINLIVTGISKLVNAQKDAIEKANELASSWKEQRNALESNKKTIDSI